MLLEKEDLITELRFQEMNREDMIKRQKMFIKPT